MQLTLAAACICYVNLQTMKRISREISSYFKKKISTVRERDTTGEQQRLSEEDGGEERTEQHDKVTQAQPVSVREHQKTADQAQSAPTMFTEARQESTKAGVQPVPGPTGEVMTVWP